MSSRKLPVSINVFPTLDYVELVQYDDKTGEIEKTSSLPCYFDMASRQVSNWEQMGQTIRDLFSMNRIPAGTQAVLVLPSFFTREIDLLAEFSKEELRFALVSEAERFYVFKRNEPQISWIKMDEGQLVYSAYPKEEIEHYVAIFKENRIPLVGIELGYFSTIRGLIATGAVQEELEAQGRWCLLVVSNYSLFVSLQEGTRLIKTLDTPLSSTDDTQGSAIQEIQQDFESFIDDEEFSKLIVVNNSSRIATEDLISGLGLSGNVTLIEQNGETLHSRGAESAQFPCSLEGIGGVFYSAFPELSRLNFLPESSEDVESIALYRREAFKWLGIVNGGLFLLCLMLWGVLTLIQWQKDQEVQSLAKQMSQLAHARNSGQFNELNRKRFVKKVVDHNVQTNNLLNRLGRFIPADTWLERVEVDAEDFSKPLQITLEGKTLELDQVNKLRGRLGEVAPDSSLEVSSAAPETSPDGQSYFTWTIQNKKETPNTGAGGRQ